MTRRAWSDAAAVRSVRHAAERVGVATAPTRVPVSIERVRVPRVALLLVGLLVPSWMQAADYEISGNLRIQGMDFETVYRSVDPVALTSLSDQASRVGSYAGNEASARWSADHALGRLSGFAYGANAFTEGIGWRWATGDAEVTLKDTLTLEVPPGSYPDGATFGVSGILSGSLQSFGSDLFADATVRWSIQLQRLDAPGYDSIEDSRMAQNGEIVAVSEPFAPAFQLLSPGAVLATPMSVTVRVTAHLMVVADTYDAFASEQLIEQSDIEDTLEILSVDVPPATTWTSASGVFLPEPVGAAQAAAAALALFVLRRRRPRRGAR